MKILHFDIIHSSVHIVIDIRCKCSLHLTVVSAQSTLRCKVNSESGVS